MQEKMQCLTAPSGPPHTVERSVAPASSQVSKEASKDVTASGLSNQESTDSLDADSVLLPLSSVDQDALHGSAEEERQTSPAPPGCGSPPTLCSKADLANLPDDCAYDLTSPSNADGFSLRSETALGAEGAKPVFGHVRASTVEDSEGRCEAANLTLPSPKSKAFVVEPPQLSREEERALGCPEVLLGVSVMKVRPTLFGLAVPPGCGAGCTVNIPMLFASVVLVY